MTMSTKKDPAAAKKADVAPATPEVDKGGSRKKEKVAGIEGHAKQEEELAPKKEDSKKAKGT